MWGRDILNKFEQVHPKTGTLQEEKKMFGISLGSLGCVLGPLTFPV